MILQPSSLWGRLSRNLYKPSARSRGGRPACWVLDLRPHTCDFSSSPRRQSVANQQDDHDFQSSCWSVLSSSASAIFSSISSSQIQKTSIPSGKIPLLAVLVTPAHIDLLKGRPEFFPNVLRHTFEILKEGQKFDVLAAVVDRIPYPIFSRPARQIDGQPLLEGAPPGTQTEDGSEGVSFAVLDSISAAPDLWSARVESKELETMTIQQRCTLSFVFPPTPIPVLGVPDGKEITQHLVSRELQLPVANTLFQNGKTSTLIAQRWRSQGSTESTFALSCFREANLPQQTLHMADVFSDQSIGLDQSLHSYLLPITPTRTITAAIGNIIRRISVDDTSDENVPASEELERAISTAIKDGRIPAEQAGVWALVRPPNCTSPGHPGVNLGGTADREVQEAVLSGCQLHKVLSGGGGWGEKQGLLALDPDSDYRMSQQAFEPSYLEDQHVRPEKLQAFGEPVKPGDTVKFYVHKSPSIPKSISESTLNIDSTKNPTSLLLRFGSLPSNMDAMPHAPSDEEDLSLQPSCMVLKHHFGMLSEQGMSLKSTFFETNLQASKVRYPVPKLLRRGLPPSQVLDELVLTTKLDAPYMTWSVEEEYQPVDHSSGVNWKKPQNPTADARTRTPQKRTKTGGKAIKSAMAHSLENNPETFDDFMGAMSTLPFHQHVATVDPHPRDTRRAAGEAGGKESPEALPVESEAARLRRRPVKQLIRKFEKAGLEVGAASVSLSKFSQVQSRIQDWVKRSEQREDAREQPQYCDSDAIQRDRKDSAHTSCQPQDDIMDVKYEKMGASGELQPKRHVHRGLRIRKHGAKLPSVMNQRLASSVRRRVILEPLSPEADYMASEEALAESDSGDSMRHHVLGGSAAWSEQHSAIKNEPEIETEASRVRSILEHSQEPLPASQSDIETEFLEQLENPRSERELDKASMEQQMSAEQPRRRSRNITCKVAGREEPPPVVRKYFGLVSKGERQIALHNLEMAARRKEGLLKRKAHPMPKSKEGLIRMDPTWHNSPAYKKLQNMQVKMHLSDEALPTDARDKARRLHKEYHLPLLDERPSDAPRP